MTSTCWERLTWAKTSGILRQPSSAITSSSEAVITGLIIMTGSRFSFSIPTSITKRSEATPTWFAASPKPEAAYIVSIMSSAKAIKVSSIFSTFRHFFRSTESMQLTIVNSGIVLNKLKNYIKICYLK